jgi:hypothetical protein
MFSISLWKGGLFVPALLISGWLLLGQESDVLKVPLTDPSRPVSLKVSLLNGSMTVRGYEGKEVLVESSGRSRGRSSDRVPDKAKGLRRIDMNRGGLTVEEEDNRVVVNAGHNSEPNLTIQVPRRASLHLRLTNGGGITIENIDGDIDADVTNGFLTMKGVSGTVVAHALNDDVIAVLDRVTAGKPMSFTSLNGDIDVTLPANTAARLKMKTENGEIYTDFELKPEPGAAPVTESRSTGKGRYRVRVDQTVYATINGGGPDFQFNSFNGKIYIRRK